MLYHLVLQETGHPVTLPICVSTKKTRFYLHPITQNGPGLFSIPAGYTTNSRSADRRYSSVGKSGDDRCRAFCWVRWRESSRRIGDMIDEQNKNGWEMENCKCIQWCITHTYIYICIPISQITQDCICTKAILVSWSISRIGLVNTVRLALLSVFCMLVLWIISPAI